MGTKEIKKKEPIAVEKKSITKQRQYDWQVKLVFYGEYRVGKTSIKSRYRHGYLNMHNEAMGSCYFHQIIRSNAGKVMVNIQDTGGMERFGFIQPVYFRGASIIVLVFDLTNYQSFVKIDYMIEELKETVQINNVIVCLVGSKSDLTEQRKIFKEEGESKANQIPNCFYHQTSAVNGEGIHQLFHLAVDRLFKLHQICK